MLRRRTLSAHPCTRSYWFSAWLQRAKQAVFGQKIVANETPTASPSGATAAAFRPSISEIMSAASLMQELQSIQNRGGNPATALSPEQFQKMKQLIEVQQRLPGAKTNPMLKMLEQQLAAADVAKAGQHAKPSLPKHNATTPPLPQTKFQNKPTAKPLKSPGAAPNIETPALGAAAAAEQLDPEIEALFGELRMMRNAKNEFKAKFEAEQRAAQSALADVARLNSVSEDLRSRLRRAEHEVALVTSESIQLREQAKDAKSLARALTESKQEIARLQSQLAARDANHGKSDLLDSVAHREVRHLKRKIERLRRSSPVHQFTQISYDALECVAIQGNDHAPAYFLTAISDLQESVSTLSHAQWSDTAAKCGGVRCAALLGRVFWSRMVPLSRYDAQVTVVGDPQHFIDAFSKHKRFAVRVLPGSTDSTTTVLNVVSNGPLEDDAGPTVYARAWTHLHANATTQIKVAPFVSAEMLNDSSRSSITIDHSRSSGPGGQGANVSETRITATLMIDGIAVTRANCQDTRSGLINEQGARHKLLDEGLTKYNDSIARDEANALRYTKSERVSRTAWNSYVEPLLPLSDAMDECLLAAMENFVVLRD